MLDLKIIETTSGTPAAAGENNKLHGIKILYIELFFYKQFRTFFPRLLIQYEGFRCLYL